MYALNKSNNPIYETVLSVLSQNNRAREDDSEMYACVLAEIAENKGINLNKISVIRFYKNQSRMKMFPSFDSVTRIRRKVQHEHPDLCGSEENARHRNRIERLHHE
jgi:ADP-ribosylglycohydrolase